MHTETEICLANIEIGKEGCSLLRRTCMCIYTLNRQGRKDRTNVQRCKTKRYRKREANPTISVFIDHRVCIHNINNNFTQHQYQDQRYLLFLLTNLTNFPKDVSTFSNKQKH